MHVSTLAFQTPLLVQDTTDSENKKGERKGQTEREGKRKGKGDRGGELREMLCK